MSVSDAINLGLTIIHKCYRLIRDNQQLADDLEALKNTIFTFGNAFKEAERRGLFAKDSLSLQNVFAIFNYALYQIAQTEQIGWNLHASGFQEEMKKLNRQINEWIKVCLQFNVAEHSLRITELQTDQLRELQQMTDSLRSMEKSLAVDRHRLEVIENPAARAFWIRYFGARYEVSIADFGFALKFEIEKQLSKEAISNFSKLAPKIVSRFEEYALPFKGQSDSEASKKESSGKEKKPGESDNTQTIRTISLLQFQEYTKRSGDPLNQYKALCQEQNINPNYMEPLKSTEVVKTTSATVPSPPSVTETPNHFGLIETAQKVGENLYQWSVEVVFGNVTVANVEFHLHPTFYPLDHLLYFHPPYRVDALGWGTFKILFDVYRNGQMKRFQYELTFTNNTVNYKY